MCIRDRPEAGGVPLDLVEHDAGGTTVLHVDLPDASAKSQFAPQLPVAADEVLENQSDSGQRSPETFQEDATEHDAKLTEVHIVFARVAVPHEWTEEHLDQQWIADCFA